VAEKYSAGHIKDLSFIFGTAFFLMLDLLAIEHISLGSAVTHPSQNDSKLECFGGIKP
jgi:hypothetical protein